MESNPVIVLKHCTSVLFWGTEVGEYFYFMLLPLNYISEEYIVLFLHCIYWTELLTTLLCEDFKEQII